MLAIDDEKLPPPTPASIATASSVPNDTPGSSTSAVAVIGTSSSAALTIVQLRPPNFATANVYGSRSTRADGGGQRRQQELLRWIEPVLGAEEQHEHRPHAPDAEPDVLGEDREDQVAPGDPSAGRGPELGVLGAPVVDPVRTVPTVRERRDACRFDEAGFGQGGGRDGHGCTLSAMRACERQRASGQQRPAWPGNAMTVTGAPFLRCERASASERAASSGLRGRGTQ